MNIPPTCRGGVRIWARGPIDLRPGVMPCRAGARHRSSRLGIAAMYPDQEDAGARACWAEFSAGGAVSLGRGRTPRPDQPTTRGTCAQGTSRHRSVGNWRYALSGYRQTAESVANDPDGSIRSPSRIGYLCSAHGSGPKEVDHREGNRDPYGLVEGGRPPGPVDPVAGSQVPIRPSAVPSADPGYSSPAS